MRQNQMLSEIEGWWKRQSIQRQIFLSMFFITLLGVFILGNIAYNTSADAIERNYRASYDSTLKNSSKVLDMNLKSIIEAGRGFLNDAGLQRTLENGCTDGKNTFSSSAQEELKRVANSLASQQAWVNTIIFADLYGHYYHLSNTNKGSYDFFYYYEEHDMLEEGWACTARKAEGREVFFGENVMGAKGDDGFLLAKYMINPSTRKPMGYMVINLSKKLLGRSFVMSGENGPNSTYMVVDENTHNDLVYFVGEEDKTKDIMSHFSDLENNHKYVFSSVKNATTGWSVVNVITKNELSGASKTIRFTVFGVGALIILMCFFLATIISRNITRPLKQLEKVIAKVGEGERHITEEFDYGEVGRIGHKFTEMVNTNLELSEHLMEVKLNEREAELLLLQSQINPHFLYNTLDSLYFVAIMHGDDQIAEMVEALSNNFKLALNNGNKFISVADSIKWVQEYMKLQNMRFNNRFELFIDIKREILPRKTISFILQPFIENAMYHGLEPKMGKGRISIMGWQEQNDMIFTIEDDGVGIEDMSVMEKGYGIRNVRERIRLNYGENYGVTITSKRGDGTKVTIVVPVE